MKEILVVLRLITSSPNLKELTISVSCNNTKVHFHWEGACVMDFSVSVQGSSNTAAASIATSDLDFWEKDCPSDCTFGQLKSVRMSDLSCVPHEMEFIKFMLRNSPVLETMHLSPCSCAKDRILHMLVELVRFRRASARAELIFEHE